MKNSGKVFEEAIKNSVVGHMYFYRLRDSASSFGQGNSALRFSISNHYDLFIYRHPHFFPMELKSHKGKSFSIQRGLAEKGKDIKIHQIDGLYQASKVYGVHAGLLLNLSELERTYWLSIIDFKTFLQLSDKKSINESDIIEYGGILVEQHKKITRYTYNLVKLFSDIELRYAKC